MKFIQDPSPENKPVYSNVLDVAKPPSSSPATRSLYCAKFSAIATAQLMSTLGSVSISFITGWCGKPRNSSVSGDQPSRQKADVYGQQKSRFTGVNKTQESQFGISESKKAWASAEQRDDCHLESFGYELATGLSSCKWTTQCTRSSTKAAAPGIIETDR